jgi:hypothetical protein
MRGFQAGLAVESKPHERRHHNLPTLQERSARLATVKTPSPWNREQAPGNQGG